MSIESEFLSMMPDTVQVFVKSAVDKYGKPTFAASGTSYRARVQEATRRRGDDEQSLPETGVVYVYGVCNATPGDKLLLPDGNTPVIVAVDNQRDENGAHHTKITFGK